MELGLGVLHAEAPVDAGLRMVPFLFRSSDFPAKGFFVREALSEATVGETLN